MSTKGLTYLEIMIAMVILALVAAGAYATFAMTGNGPVKKGIGSLDVQAMDFARDTLERLKAAVSTYEAGGNPSLIDTTGKPAHNDPLPVASFLYSSCAGTRSYTVQDVKDAGGNVIYKAVTVTVDWNDK